jgi:hypothetical protein
MRHLIGKLLTALAICTLLGCHLNSLVDVIPPYNLTISSMTETEVRIGMYLNEHGELPDDFSVLPTRDHYANSTTDGWGRPLMYAHTKNDSFTLTSLGRDGEQGGKGDDADIVEVYQVENGEIKNDPLRFSSHGASAAASQN